MNEQILSWIFVGSWFFMLVSGLIWQQKRNIVPIIVAIVSFISLSVSISWYAVISQEYAFLVIPPMLFAFALTGVDNADS